MRLSSGGNVWKLNQQLRSSELVHLDGFGSAGPERAFGCQGNEQSLPRLLAGAVLGFAALLDAFDEVRDLGPPRVGAFNGHRRRLAPCRIETKAAQSVRRADVPAVLCGRRREPVLGDAAFAKHADVAREGIRLRHEHATLDDDLSTVVLDGWDVVALARVASEHHSRHTAEPVKLAK